MINSKSNPDSNKVLDSFGDLLGIFRKQANKTQQDLAEAVEKLGYPVDVTTISKYESGSRRPEAEFIPYFAGALKLPAQDEKALLDAYIEHDRILALQSYLKGKQNVEQIRMEE